jgi:hypothetical protein
VFDFLPFLGADSRTIELSETEKALKRQMYDEFASQKECLTRFPISIERFRSAPRYQFTVAPHEGTLDYERYCTVITGAEWRNNAGKALEALRTRKRRLVQSVGVGHLEMRIAG